MAAFSFICIVIGVIGFIGLRVSGAADVMAKRHMTVRWYDHVFTMLMFFGALGTIGGVTALAWKFLP